MSMPLAVAAEKYLKNMLIESYKRESEAAVLYEVAAKAEKDVRRREILLRLANVERKHAQMWADKLRECGGSTNQAEWPRVDRLRPGDLARRLEALERGNATWYETQRPLMADPSIRRIIDEIEEEEERHGTVVQDVFMTPADTAVNALKRVWSLEKFHKSSTGGWLGDAIYGVNDGLGAIFGIIAGVAGFTNNSHIVLVSGFFGALASTLSMGAGAWLATKSEGEHQDREVELERQEIADSPEHEIEECAILYELKGFSTGEARDIAERIAQRPEAFLRVMSQEELGIYEDAAGSPWMSAGIGAVSTFVGGIVPLIPFFFLSGLKGMAAAAVVSLLAHFAVGAAKTTVTARSWWKSGLEMTMAGVIVGVVSYGVGWVGTQVFHV